MNLPCKSCKAECCISPALTLEEYDFLKAKYPDVLFKEVVLEPGLPVLRHIGRVGQRCPFVKKNNRCSIYNERPNVCREFGVHEKLPCPKVYPNAIFRRAE